MKTENLSNKNLAFYASKEAVYNAISPVLWGTITQQFLLYRGVSATLVGYYATLVSAVQMAFTMLLSNTAEKVKDPLKFCTRMMILLTIVSAFLLPIAMWDLGSRLTLLLICAMSIAQLGLHSCKVICDYKINYQIISPARYGTMVFLCNAITGLAGVAFTALFSAMIDANTAGNPYLICMALTLAMLVLSVFLNTRLKPIHPVPRAKRSSIGLLQQLNELIHERSFRDLIIPNLLRGITLSVTSCIVLIALVMDIDESGRAKIPLICALATACASVLYMFLSKKLSVGAINIIGGILTCAMIFLPRGNTGGFLALFFVAYVGRVIVDNAVPTMIFPIIDPSIAGSYNAWRSVLYGISSLVVMPIISSLVEVVHPLWLLIPGSVTYLAVTIWYYIVCKNLTK